MKYVSTFLSLLLYGVFGVCAERLSVFVKEGDSVTLQSVKTAQQGVEWYFFDDLIAKITGHPSKTCTDVQCEGGTERFKFRDRLKLDHQTGSLTITNTRTTDSGVYTLWINNNDGSSFTDKFISVAVRGFFGIGSDGVSVFVMEGDSVTLHTGVKTNQPENMNWYFQNSWNLKTSIAQITDFLGIFCTDIQCHEYNDGFRNRLEMNRQTGSLTIRNIRTTDLGRYYLDFSMSSNNDKSFSVSPYDVPAAEIDEMKRKLVKEGESVTLDPKVVKNPNDLFMWYFNNTLIAEITGDQSKICTDDQCDERFKDRLKLDHQTGSLTITNIRTTDSGGYKLQIDNNRIGIIKSFSVSVTSLQLIQSDWRRPYSITECNQEFKQRLLREMGNDVYIPTSRSQRKGLALLITNIKFDHSEYNRHGAEKDEANMEWLLRALGYNVVKHTNLSGDEIDGKVKNFATLSEHQDSTFVVIMSHGTRIQNKDAILGVHYDPNLHPNDYFFVEDIFSHLDSVNCPALIDKPKVILIQACRGEHEGGVYVPDRVVHREKDFVCFMSSLPDTASYRNPDNGSFFIMYIVDVFSTCAHNDDIMELFRKVASRMANDPRFTKVEKLLPCIERMSLVRKFYLFPGL